jgi:hypothetical protein
MIRKRSISLEDLNQTEDLERDLVKCEELLASIKPRRQWLREEHRTWRDRRMYLYLEQNLIENAQRIRHMLARRSRCLN